MRCNIKWLRVKADLTQAQLANKVKVSRQTIHSYEANKIEPTATILFKIAKALECKPEELYELEE